ncbi:hypothetical protein H9Q69_004557 [Fusarium xylarioides]|uniref:Uncharacterized protein n=1 Tax=Fusarium xylarioides TaxID=221167 RepID=A0A9P7IAF8_9HYPO|nr:hypothetical protein H9Q72_001499 [Fusarium xylarioides]KAG5796426.1 hypothetical protein H9Q69_004557 [Fusarium xylarioides]KAG5812452.1 hypothetical protein H9Q71_004335 [Fusarium xylarioides]KAG5817071.1 hypothetical protein H9Q74_010736 [Fusarium xylarioides]
MVGISRSKACADCRRRRVKCDLTSPRCQRCTKAGIICRGIRNTPTLWVHRTPTQPNVSALSVIQSQQQTNWLSLLQRMRSQINSKEAYDVPTFRSQALSIAVSIYFPQGRYTTSEEDHSSTPSSWLKAVCNMEGPSEALDYSLVAFVAIQIRLSGEVGVSYDEAIELYNHALSKVIHVLDCPCVLGRNDESIAAIVILSTCELFLFHASTSWNAHAQGVSEILRHRSVPDTNTASWNDLCRRLCVICVIQALSQKKPLNLEPKLWREHIGPWAAPESFGALLDMTIDIPSVMAEAYALASSLEANGERLSRYIDLLTEKFYLLENWRVLVHRNIAARNQTPLFWSVPSRASNPADDGYPDKLFPFALMFSSVEAASPWILGSSIMLDILETILLLRAKVESMGVSTSLGKSNDSYTGNDLPNQADADHIARMLCQSVEYCYRSENGTFGPQITCNAQATLLGYFAGRGMKRELEWCRGIKYMTGPGTSFGIDLMQFKPPPEL